MSGIEKESHELEPLKQVTVADRSYEENFSSEREVDSKKIPWYHVNRKLLSVKLIYFTFISGMGSLIPFIPLYMKQLGLSTTETGMLIGVMPFIAFFVQPMFGAVADKTRKPKVVLIVCLVCSGIFFNLLLLPGRFSTQSREVSFKVHLECNDEGIIVHDEHCDIKENHTLESNTSDLLDMVINTKKSQNSCSITCNRLDDLLVNSTGCSYVNGTGKSCEVETGGYVGTMSILDYNDSNMSTCNIQHLENIPRDWNVTCKPYGYTICNIYCRKACPSINGTSFWIFAGIYLCANIFWAPILSLIDAMAYSIFGDKRHLWGRQRLWGTLGFAICSMTTTVVRDVTKGEGGSVDYSISFYMYGTMCFISCIVVTTLGVPETFHCHRMLRNVTTLFRIPRVIGFFLVVICLGMLQSVWIGFLFWYLEDLGSNQIIIGLCCVTTAFSEIIFLSISGKIIQLIGHLPCLYIALLAYSVRHLSYSFLTNSWFVLPIELTHGVCLGLMYAAASAYASIISPEGTVATMQGLIAGCYFGFGRGLGFFVTGKLFDPVSGLGGRWTFRFYSLLAFTVLIVYASTNTIASKYSRSKNSGHESYQKKEQSAASDATSPAEPFLDNKV